MLRVLSSRSEPGYKVSRVPVVDGWKIGDSSIIEQEAGRSRKLACVGFGATEGRGGAVRNVGGSTSEASSSSGAGSNVLKGDDTARDPIDALGEDVFQCHIMPLLDPCSLARCAAVSTAWRVFANAEALWQSIVTEFLANRAHLPLCIMYRDLSSMSPLHVYSIALEESRQQELVPADLCNRSWELRLKPACGPYWLSLANSVGKRGLRRYFHCDGTISSVPDDPIWGGQESVWKCMRLKGRDGSTVQHVQVNHWPPFAVRRMKEGCWILENIYASYISRPDNPAFHPGCSTEKHGLCSSCSPPTYGLM